MKVTLELDQVKVNGFIRFLETKYQIFVNTDFNNTSSGKTILIKPKLDNIVEKPESYKATINIAENSNRNQTYAKEATTS